MRPPLAATVLLAAAAAAGCTTFEGGDVYVRPAPTPSPVAITRVVWRDANDAPVRDLGPSLYALGVVSLDQAYLDADGYFWAVSPVTGLAIPAENSFSFSYYTTNNCTGTAWYTGVPPPRFTIQLPNEMGIYRSRRDGGTSMNLDYQSRLLGANCTAIASTATLATSINDLPIIPATAPPVLPYAPPFRPSTETILVLGTAQ